MKAKEYLNSLKAFKAETDRLTYELYELKAALCTVRGAGLSEDGVKHEGGCRSGAGFERLVEKYMLKEEKLAERLMAYEDKKELIIHRIKSLEDLRYSELLYKKYAEFKDLTDICEEMNYSYPHIKRLHRQALKAFYERYLIKNTGVG